MTPGTEASRVPRLAVLIAGLVVVGIAAFLLWAALTAPLNYRLPVPSPDGRYFAYFNPPPSSAAGEGAGLDLIVSSPSGELVARLPVEGGSIHWSNASHLTIVNPRQTEATLIAKAQDRFVVLTRLPLGQRAEPRWSRDGNKLAYVGAGSGGDGLSVFDIQQPRTSIVPLPPGITLRQPVLLSWSPGSEELFFLNLEGQGFVLERVDVRTGSLQALAGGIPTGTTTLSERPRLSPDGTKIHLPRPRNAVIDAQSGQTVWMLPIGAEALWSPWSGDGRYLYYAAAKGSAEILAHDFADASSRVVASGVQPNGFFTADGQKYLYRQPRGLLAGGSAWALNGWLDKRWGWQQVDVAKRTSQPLGRVELWPWEQTLDGLILARQDDYTKTVIGLYDPEGQQVDEYVFPTAREDLSRQIKSDRFILLSVAFFAVLAFLVFGKRPESRPARAFSLLMFWLVLWFAGQALCASVRPLDVAPPFPLPRLEIQELGWWARSSLWQVLCDKVVQLATFLWALVPPVLVYFALTFPEGTRFLAKRKALSLLLWIAAFLPLAVVLEGSFAPRLLGENAWGFLIFGASVAALAVVGSLVYSHRHPPDRRGRDQVRWVALAVGVLAAGGLLLLLLHVLAGPLAGGGAHGVAQACRAALLVLIGGVAPLAVGYALVARKPYSMRLLTRRALRHSLMTLTVLAVFLLLLGGLNWLTTGSLLSLSAPAILAAVLLAALITMPLRGRLRNFFDRTFDRSQYDFREGVVEFARGLPHIFDHPTLVARLEETLKRAMRARRFYFFVLDRQTRTLGPQSGGGERPAQVEGVKFDPLEPLCRYLMEKRRPFEVEVSPYSPELVPVFRSAADRLGKLGAAVVVGLRRRHELLGLMILGSKTSDEFYDAEELDLLMILAREAALAVENIDLFEEVARDRELRKELEDASELQAQLLPGAPPHLVRGRILGRCIPCRSVGGDFFDFLELPGEKVGLVIADVSGKGMTASLMAANVHRLLHSHSPAAETLTELTARMNRQLYESSRGARYCAMFCGVYDDASRRLEYVNAGHCPPLLLAPWGERFLEATGLPLGLFPEVNHRPRSELLDSGTVVVFYSDGITDAPNGRGESYGLDRLVGVVSHHRELDPPRLLAKILEDIQDFSAGAPIEDDQTLVLLRIV